MRKFSLIAVLTGIVLVGLGSANGASLDANIESFMTLSAQLEEAIEVRNFQKAREVVDELLPLMKEHIKVSKKTLSSLKKAEEPSVSPEEYESEYNRKVELHDSVKHLMELSSAALRGKSNLIVSEVKEFIKLMEDEPSES